MTEALFALAGAIVGGILAYAIAGRRATDRETRVRAEADQRITDLKEQQANLREQFAAISQDVLQEVAKSNSTQFLELADERFKRTVVQHDAELAKREEAVKQMVEPVSKALDEVRRQTTEVEKARAEGQAALREQVHQMVTVSQKLDKKTTDFINTLRRSDVRGNWGEVALQRVVELAGLREHVDYTQQETVKGEEGQNLRPDLVVHLPGGREIVVDSKVAWSALIEAFDTEDDGVRKERLVAHARQVKKHVDDLSGKKYSDQFATAPDFVVMFVPSEAFYQAAAEQDASLQEYAFERNVVIATPATLVAMLRTVAHTWREAALAENARDVLSAGQELHHRLLTMGKHFAKLGRALDSAGKAYDGVVGSYEQSVLPSSRRLADLKVIDKAIDAPAALDLHTRSMRTIESGPDAIGLGVEPSVDDLDHEDAETDS